MLLNSLPRGAFAALLAVLCVSSIANAQNAKIVRGTVNWEAAAAAAKSDSGISDADKSQGLSRIKQQVDKLDQKAKTGKSRPDEFKSLLQVNATTSKAIPLVAEAGVPVLLPFEVKKLATDLLAGPTQIKKNTTTYLGGLRLKEFRPDKNGYYAELSTPSGRGMTIQASSVFASLDGSGVETDQSREAEYTQNEYEREAEFSRYGVTYKITLSCVPMKIKDDICRDDKYLRSTVDRLKVIGGVPTP